MLKLTIILCLLGFIHWFLNVVGLLMALRRVKCGGWPELYPDLLDEIAKHIPVYEDHIRLRAVCKSWNTVLPNVPKVHKRSMASIAIR